MKGLFFRHCSMLRVEKIDDDSKVSNYESYDKRRLGRVHGFGKSRCICRKKELPNS